MRILGIEFVSRRTVGVWAVPALIALLSGSAGYAQQPATAPVAEADKAAPGKPAADDTASNSQYRIGAGDVLSITVWNEAAASVPSGVVVRPDGKISLPLVKELDALGLTPKELEKILTAKLERFIHAPDVSVVVKEIRSKKVYLVGAVSKVGAVSMQSSMTVLQVLAEAGGPTDFAKKKKIYILRTENGKQVKLPFDYAAVIKGEHMEQNIVMMPDDTIVVPQ